MLLTSCRLRLVRDVEAHMRTPLSPTVPVVKIPAAPGRRSCPLISDSHILPSTHQNSLKYLIARWANTGTSTVYCQALWTDCRNALIPLGFSANTRCRTQWDVQRKISVRAVSPASFFFFLWTLTWKVAIIPLTSYSVLWDQKVSFSVPRRGTYLHMDSVWFRGEKHLNLGPLQPHGRLYVDTHEQMWFTGDQCPAGTPDIKPILEGEGEQTRVQEAPASITPAPHLPSLCFGSAGGINDLMWDLPFTTPNQLYHSICNNNSWYGTPHCSPPARCSYPPGNLMIWPGKWPFTLWPVVFFSSRAHITWKIWARSIGGGRWGGTSLETEWLIYMGGTINVINWILLWSQGDRTFGSFLSYISLLRWSH